MTNQINSQIDPSIIDNPLLKLESIIDFRSIETNHYRAAIDYLLDKSKKEIQAISNYTGIRTFENTVLAIDQACEALSRAYNVITHIGVVCNSEEHKKAYDQIQPDVIQFFSSIYLDQELWNSVKQYANSPEAEHLDPLRKRCLEEVVDSFKRAGADLNATQKKRIIEIDIKLSELTTKFRNNQMSTMAEFELIIEDEDLLVGLPELHKTIAHQSASKIGKSGWRFTLQQALLGPALEYLDSSEIREKLWRANVKIASSGEKNNALLIPEILALRQEKAAMLGYNNFVDLVTERRMVKSGSRALNFLNELATKFKDTFEREKQELLNFKRESINDPKAELFPWDISYYERKMCEAFCNFDGEELRPYLQSEKVLNGFFKIANVLYGVDINKTNDLPVWHEDVQVYTVSNNDNTILAKFYVDFYAREGRKRSGAWMNNFIIGDPEKGTPHLGLICTNFSEPGPNSPSLISLDEAKTIFHEMGHLMHLCLSNVPIRMLAGLNVAWDFVELPSTIMENWCEEPEALALFAIHYENGKAIPEELLSRAKQARKFRSISDHYRRLHIGTLDLLLHIEYQSSNGKDLINYSRKIADRFATATLPDDYAVVCQLNHLFSSPVGYAGGYYSYTWCEALEADAFNRFKQEGILNQKVGLDFRALLASGNSFPPEVLFNNFMKRPVDAPPDLMPLLIREGAITPQITPSVAPIR